MKVREEFRNIFFEMGYVTPSLSCCNSCADRSSRRFTEMPTNRFVESGFWNFDALFVPQQHPARELQDTFYLKDPVASDKFPQDYYERVAKVHESGGYGSVGYRAPFSKAETSRLVMRTHTTSVSAAMLYQIANQPGGFKPAKLFSIDRVFRNEAVDATHLAEFHQVEGVIADRDLTLADLIGALHLTGSDCRLRQANTSVETGFMQIFFEKMGVRNLRFKPAFNPYTEASLFHFADVLQNRRQS